MKEFGKKVGLYLALLLAAWCSFPRLYAKVCRHSET